MAEMAMRSSLRQMAIEVEKIGRGKQESTR
jgi:hypothetical protein